MQILMISGIKGTPALLGNVKEAYVTEFNHNIKVVITTEKSVTDFVPRGFMYDEEIREQCYLCVRFLAQEIARRTPIVKIDEQGCFDYDKNGTIIAVERLPF